MDWSVLQPQLLWEHFRQMTRIPRPSGQEEAIRNHLIAWAEKRSFKHNQDRAGNLLVQVPATAGNEQSRVTILQGHMDMVTEKEPSSEVDPAKDPLDIYIEGEYMRARGTTLGADNGIGVAAALAVVDDPQVQHGPIEILLTVEEEMALRGAAALDPNLFSGNQMINLDAEEAKMLFIGSAGSEDTYNNLPISYEKAAKTGKAYRIDVSGLKGGHSGVDIHRNTANAIKLLTHALRALAGQCDFQLCDIKGGTRRNVIAREAEAIVLLPAGEEEKTKQLIDQQQQFIRKLFDGIEENLTLRVTPLAEHPTQVISKDSSQKILRLLAAMPHGVAAMSRDVPGSVETSNNLAQVYCEGGKAKIVNLRRSSFPEALEDLSQQIMAVAELAGATHLNKNTVPTWKPNTKSTLFKLTSETFREIHGGEVKVTAVHAGMECCFLNEKNPAMEMIAFGPDVDNMHTPDEQVHIGSVEQFYRFLSALLHKLAQVK